MQTRELTPKQRAAAAAALLFAVVFTSAQASNEGSSETSGKRKLVDMWQPGDNGERMNIRGLVTSLDGTPLSGINIQIRQPNGDGDWAEQYHTTLTTDDRGRYQFGSVVPVSHHCGDPHVEVVVYQDGFGYFDDKMVFEQDSGADHLYYGEGSRVFLEESEVNGEVIKYGRFDIVLSPE